MWIGQALFACCFSLVQLPCLWGCFFSSFSAIYFFSFPSHSSISSLCPYLPSPPAFPLFLRSSPPSSVREKFVEVDLKPVCKHCYERLPDDMKRRLARQERDSKDKKKKSLIPMCLWSSLSPFLHLHCSSFGQFPSPFAMFILPDTFILISLFYEIYLLGE